MIVNFKKAGRLQVGSIVLIPGPNKVDPKAWLEMRQHPTIARKIDDGQIVEETDIEEVTELVKQAESQKGSTPAAVAAVVDVKMYEHLLTLKVPQARSLVEETVELKLLEEWQKRETRNQVKSSLKKQIELMKEPMEERDRSAKRQLSGTGMTPDVIEVKANPSAQDD